MSFPTLDGIRYLVAAVVVVTVSPAFVGWLLLHGFIDRWRQLGPRVAYPVTFLLVASVALGIHAIRAPLLAVEFGGSLWRLGLAGAVYALAVLIEASCWRSLSLRTLVGLPELMPTSEPQQLLTEGIYGRVRHPRYLGFVLGVLAVAFATDYLALYLLVPIFLLQIYWVTVLEERELVDRFGARYAAYQARVPRLLPRLRAIETVHPTDSPDGA